MASKCPPYARWIYPQISTCPSTDRLGRAASTRRLRASTPPRQLRPNFAHGSPTHDAFDKRSPIDNYRLAATPSGTTTFVHSDLTSLRPSSKRKAKAKRTAPRKRSGKWELEEERFTQQMIQGFLAGILPLERGTTLRSFLAKQLNCDPMRITKKLSSSVLAGSRISERVGKRTFRSSGLPRPKVHQQYEMLRHLRREFWAAIQQDPPSDALNFESSQPTEEDLIVANTLIALALQDNPTQH